MKFITVKDLKGPEVERFRYNPFFIYPIVDDPKIHWTQQCIIGVYYREIRGLTEFYINYEHYDVLERNSNTTKLWPKKTDVVFSSELMGGSHSIGGFDAEVLYWVHTGKSFTNLEIKKLPVRLFPLYKIFEHCRELAELIDPLEVNDTVVNYCNFQNVLHYIEQRGIQTVNGEVHTKYNMFTLTGRPSNSFGGINFAALNKTDETRKQFVSRFKNGWLVEFDFHAYHVHLLAKIVGYQFENPKDVYGELAIQLNHDGETMKTEVFHQIYGGINSKYLHHPFFKKISVFTTGIDINAYDSLFFRRKMPKVENNVKALNYLLQNLETEINSLILDKIKDLLASYKTELILYTYDSFLFDYNPEDTPKVFYEIKKILEAYDVPTHFKIGRDYHTMFTKNL